MSKRIKNRTSKHHFTLFKRVANNAVEALGLKEYEIEYAHEFIEAKADVALHEGVIARVRLSTDWGDCVVSDEQVILTAKHEVLHILLHRMMLVAHERFGSASELARAEHDVVYRLEKIL